MNRKIKKWLRKKLLPSPVDPFFVWEELGLSRCDLLRVATPHGKFWLTPKDKVISAHLFAKGGFEFEQFSRVVAFLRAAWPTTIAPVFVDVGANIGTHTIYALNSGFFSRAICIEPDVKNFDLLARNVTENDYATRAMLFNIAMGEAEGEAEMELAGDNFGDHRIRFGAGHGENLFKEQSRAVVKTRLRALDDVLDEARVDPGESVLHIDVQGFEAFVLAGASRTLAACPMIFSEFWPYGLKRNGSWDRYREIVSQHFSGFYDVRTLEGPAPRFYPVGALQEIFTEFEAGGGSTDLVFVRQP